MKILFLARRFYPDDGGVEKHIREISKVLIDNGYQINLITQSTGKINSYQNIDITRIPKRPKGKSEKIHVWKWFWTNRNLIKEADIVHAHDVYWWYWPFRFIFLSKKSFVTFHGYESYPVKKGVIISRKISEMLSDGNIIVGDFMKKWYKTKPNYVIYGGVNTLETKNRKQELNNQNPMIKNAQSAVFIGRLDEHTGILDYANAVDEIRKKYPNFKFQILGEGKYMNKLNKYKPIGFKTNVNYYLQQNNFVFVSRYLSILEAFANKRLVIAHFDNLIKEDYLRMTPYKNFIEIVSSPQEVAQIVFNNLKNPKLAEKRINDAYRWVIKYSWENVVKKYISLWHLN